MFPIDIIRIIINDLSIIDKKNIIRCCKHYYQLCPLIADFETKFCEFLNSTQFVSDKKIVFNRHELYALEFLVCNRNVPAQYLIDNTRLFTSNPKLYRNLIKMINNPKLFEKIYNIYGKHHIKQIMIEAIIEGKMKIVKWAWHHEEKHSWNSYLCKKAAENGHLEVLKWLRGAGCNWDSHTCAYAALNGHVEILKWAYKNGCPLGKNTGYIAASGGNLDILKWAIENGCKWHPNIFVNAAYNGHVEILQWAKDDMGRMSCRDICNIAARNGQLEVLQWARKNGYGWDNRICNYAAIRGNLEMLKWARENGCEWDNELYSCASIKGRIEILKWVHENGLLWSDKIYASITILNHPEVIKWQHENNCEWIFLDPVNNYDDYYLWIIGSNYDSFINNYVRHKKIVKINIYSV